MSIFNTQYTIFVDREKRGQLFGSYFAIQETNPGTFYHLQLKYNLLTKKLESVTLIYQAKLCIERMDN